MGCAVVTQLQTRPLWGAATSQGEGTHWETSPRDTPEKQRLCTARVKVSVVLGLQGGTEVSAIVGAGGWGLFSQVSFPLIEIIWQNKSKMRLCSLIRGCTPQQTLFVFNFNLRTASSSYDIMERCSICKMCLPFDLKDIMRSTLSMIK